MRNKLYSSKPVSEENVPSIVDAPTSSAPLNLTAVGDSVDLLLLLLLAAFLFLRFFFFPVENTTTYSCTPFTASFLRATAGTSGVSRIRS